MKPKRNRWLVVSLFLAGSAFLLFIGLLALVWWVGQRGDFSRSRSNREMQQWDPPRPVSMERVPLTNFSTRLPVIVLHTQGQDVSRDYLTRVGIDIFPAGQSDLSTSSKAEHSSLATIRYRGSSSGRLPKLSYTLHLVDAETNQVKVALLGMPKEEDWVLYAPFEDKTLMRDVLAYEMARNSGHYAPRTRFVELFVHSSSGPVSASDYEGVYVLIEKIKRGKDRVNISKLEREDRAEPEITGGYIVKRDHPDREGRRFFTESGGPYFYVYPNDRSITAEQRSWLTAHFNAFERVLYGPRFADPQSGYASYLDVMSFIDAHWLIEVSKNVDGFRYSAFLTKDRNGKIRTEPPWDWNRAFGNANYYGGGQPEGWYWKRLRPTEISWHLRLREDPAYLSMSRDRWKELRRTAFDPQALHRRIDEIATELEGAHQRNFARWRILGRHVTCNHFVGSSYEEEVRWMKDWIQRRIAWIDDQVDRSPEEQSRSHQDRDVNAPF